MVAGRSHARMQTTWVAIMDLACLIAGSVVGVMLRFGHEEVTEYVYGHLEGWLLLYGGVLLANYLAGSYKIQYTFSRFNLIVTWAFSLVFAMLILSITSYAWITVVLGRGVLFLSLASYSIMALVLKLLVYRSLFRSDVFLCRTVILGTGARARRLRRMVESDYVLPVHKVVAFIRLPGDQDGIDQAASVVEGVVTMGAVAGGVQDIVRSLDVGLIVLAPDDMAVVKDFSAELRRLRFEGIEVLTPTAVCEIYAGLTPLDLLDDEVLMQVGMESRLPMIRRIKRMTDILLSLVAIVLLAPLGLLVAALVKVSAPRSPVLYSQLRTGQFGREFRILKFRTMREGAEFETGPVWAQENDPRVTRLGRVLRRFRLDETPQFLNILRGDMSLVGPRPERPEIAAELEKRVPFYGERENVMPGLSGWAQVRYPYGSTPDDARRKLEYDLYYIKHLSLALDLQIVLSTIRIVLFGLERSH